MIRDGAALSLARGILGVYSVGADEHVIEVLATLIQFAVKNDEARQEIEQRESHKLRSVPA